MEQEIPGHNKSTVVKLDLTEFSQFQTDLPEAQLDPSFSQASNLTNVF
jgi:hypothetical protein